MKNCVIAAVDDMFFAAKIRAVAEHLSIDVRFAKSVAALIETARDVNPSLFIFDLHTQKYDPFALAAQLKADEQLRRTPLIGFYSHVETALRQQAIASGFDRVLPRSAFTKQLAEILSGTDQLID